MNFKSLFCKSLLLLFVVSVFAPPALADEHLVVNTTAGGQVKDKILDSDFEDMTSLEIVGPVDAADWEYLTSNSGIMASLRTLNLRKATPVLDGGTYNTYVEPTGSMGVSYIYEYKFWPRDSVSGYYSLDGWVTTYWGNNVAGGFIKTSFEKVVLPESIDGIGNRAFMRCDKLKEVVASSGVTSVGDNAFDGVATLESLELPGHLTSIGACSFRNTSSLRHVDLSQVNKLDFKAFEKSGIEEIRLCDGLPSVPEDAFYACKSLKSAVIPGSVKSIEESAFIDCEALESLTLGAGIESIGQSAFRGAAIESVVLPQSLRSLGNSSFSWCRKLTTVNLPENLTAVGDGAFENTPFIKNYPAEDGVIYLGKVAYALTDDVPVNLVIKEGIVSIADELLSHYILKYGVNNYVHAYDFVESVSLPSTLKRIGRRAFRNLSKVSTIDLPEGLEEIGEEAFRESKIEKIELPQSLKIIEDKAFQECKLTKISLPEGLDEIHAYAFDACPIVTLVLPEGLKVLGYEAFANNKNLVKLTLNSVNLIGKGSSEYKDELDLDKYAALCGCQFTNTSCDRFIIGDKVERIPDYFFCDAIASFKELQLPATMRYIGKHSFRNQLSLESVIFPDALEVIEESAFENNYLRELTLPENVRFIGDNAFAYSTKLEKVTYNCRNADTGLYDDRWGNIISGKPFERSPFSQLSIGDAVEYIPGGLFEDSYASFESVDLSNIKEIGVRAFDSCSFLKEVKWSDKLERVGDYAFSQCNALSEVTLPASLKYIGAGAFLNCWPAFRRLSLPASLEYVGDGAFTGCSWVYALFIPDNDMTVEPRAFGFKKDQDNIKVISMRNDPLVTDPSPFVNNRNDDCTTNWTLTVPYSREEAYRSANGWNGFKEYKSFGKLWCDADSVFTADFSPLTDGILDPVTGAVINGVFCALGYIDYCTDFGSLCLYSRTSEEVAATLPGRRMETDDLVKDYGGLYLMLPAGSSTVELEVELSDIDRIGITLGNGETRLIQGEGQRIESFDFDVAEPTPMFIYRIDDPNTHMVQIHSLKIYPEAAGISDIVVDETEAEVTGRYLLDGRKVDNPLPGQVVIERLSNGSARKTIAL